MVVDESGDEMQTVEISGQYLTYLHDIISEGISEFEELFGGSAPMMIYEVAADQVAEALGDSSKARPGFPLRMAPWLGAVLTIWVTGGVRMVGSSWTWFAL